VVILSVNQNDFGRCMGKRFGRREPTGMSRGSGCPEMADSGRSGRLNGPSGLE